MAAPKKKKATCYVENVSDSSSDSSDSENERLKEAAIDASQLVSTNQKKLAFSNQARPSPSDINKPSLRPSHTNDEVDEMGTTPEFKAHIAKKLSEIIDESVMTQNVEPVSIIEDVPSSSSEETFKLFSTSLPHEKQKVQECKRRLSSSSSDSDEETKLASVAVTGNFILSQGQKLKQEDAAKLAESPVDGNVIVIKTSKKKKKKKKKQKEAPADVATEKTNGNNNEKSDKSKQKNCHS